MEVRWGRVEDVAGVMELERGVQEAPHWGEAVYRGVVSPGADAVRRCLLVAVEAGEVVGFAVGSVPGEVGEMESVVVGAGWRRRGVGEGLCRAVLAWAWGEGAEAVELEVRAGSVGAIALYERLGFQRTGLRKGYYAGPVEDALQMRVEART